jgi:hypothetical protein|eukprot:COSAG01_NODE_5100_length_4487_cov_995.366226_3_plen_94_part_00
MGAEMKQLVSQQARAAKAAGRKRRTLTKQVEAARQVSERSGGGERGSSEPLAVSGMLCEGDDCALLRRRALRSPATHSAVDTHRASIIRFAAT